MSSTEDKEKIVIANFNKVESCEPVFDVVTITHDQLAEPIRLNNSTQDIVIQGNMFFGCPFVVKHGSVDSNEKSKPKLRIANIGRKMTEYIVLTNGIRCAILEFGLITKSCPDYIHPKGCYELLDLCLDCYWINFEMGHTFLDNPATTMCFNECNNPGLH